MEPGRRQGLRRPLEQQSGHTGQGPAWSWPTSRSASGTTSGSSRSAARTTVYLNDKLVVDHATMENFWDRKTPPLRPGPIQLQTHGGEIRWRNVFLREIPPQEANAILAKHGAEGFKPLFDGKNLDGWAGPKSRITRSTKGRSAACRTKGGRFTTTRSIADFVARLEFRLPPGRQQRPGDPLSRDRATPPTPACASFRSSTTATRNTPSSTRGRPTDRPTAWCAAHRGYLRPVGEWNFEEVTVKGPKIKVELNGTVILDTDLSEVNEYMANSPHPGKDRISGFFGFAGHNDPVEFRDIAIKPLD